MSLDDLYAPLSTISNLIRLDRANAYVVGTTEPQWQRRGMIWADTSTSPPTLKMLTDSGWVDIRLLYKHCTYLGGGGGNTTSTSSTAINTVSTEIPTSMGVLGFIQYQSSGSGYGRVGLSIGATANVNAPTADGTCLGRDDTTNRGGSCIMYIPRRDLTWSGDFGLSMSARIGTSDVFVRVGASVDPPAGDWTTGITLNAACSAAATTVYARWKLFGI